MMKRLLILLLCLTLAAALSACRRGTIAPTSPPTLTPTPRSTSLPPIQTPIPVGAAGNSIHMIFPIVDTVRSDQAINAALRDLADALSEESGLSIETERVDSDAEAVAALCASLSGTVSVAWLNGVAYAAADAQNCGTAALQVRRDGATTERAVLITQSGSRITGVAGLDGADFCRVSATDFYSWLMPTIIMATNNFSPADLGSVTDYEDVTSLIEAVAAGDCDAAGVAQTDFESASAQDIDDLPGSIAVPIAVLAYPDALPTAQRELLNDALIAIGNGSRAELLEPLLNQDDIVEADEGDLSAMRGVLSRAGIDLAAMNSE